MIFPSGIFPPEQCSFSASVMLRIRMETCCQKRQTHAPFLLLHDVLWRVHLWVLRWYISIWKLSFLPCLEYVINCMYLDWFLRDLEYLGLVLHLLYSTWILGGLPEKKNSPGLIWDFIIFLAIHLSKIPYLEGESWIFGDLATPARGFPLTLSKNSF